jgi:hypothetical protein
MWEIAVRKFLIGSAVAAALTVMMLGLVLAVPAVQGDSGPKEDVAAVRAAQHQLAPHDYIRKVHVVGDYALLGWYTLPEGNGAINAFKRISGERWKKLGGSGGVLSLGDLIHWGIPELVAHRLCAGFPNACTAR